LVRPLAVAHPCPYGRRNDIDGIGNHHRELGSTDRQPPASDRQPRTLPIPGLAGDGWSRSIARVLQRCWAAHAGTRGASGASVHRPLASSRARSREVENIPHSLSLPRAAPAGSTAQ